MILDSAKVGQVIAGREVEVTFRDSALYAAAIGAERDDYLDDRTPGGALAPPTFTVSLEWPLVGGPEPLAAIGVPGNELFRRLLHTFQDSRFHRPVRVGSRLRLEAVLASVSQTKSGALAVTRIRTVDARSDEAVAESWFGAYFRDTKAPVPCCALQPPAIEPPASAEGVFRETIAISRGQSHLYGECARLWNPIHTELSFATSLGLPDIALHGTLLWAKMGEIAIDRHLGGDPEKLQRLAVRFRRPIFPNRNMTLETCAPTVKPGHVSMSLLDDERSETLSDGLAIGSTA